MPWATKIFRFYPSSTHFSGGWNVQGAGRLVGDARSWNCRTFWVIFSAICIGICAVSQHIGFWQSAYRWNLALAEFIFWYRLGCANDLAAFSRFSSSVTSTILPFRKIFLVKLFNFIKVYIKFLLFLSALKSIIYIKDSLICVLNSGAIFSIRPRHRLTSSLLSNRLYCM